MQNQCGLMGNDSLHEPHFRAEILSGLLQHLRLLVFVLHGLVDEAADDRVVIERREELLGWHMSLRHSIHT